MTPFNEMFQLPLPDLAALAVLFASWIGIGLAIEHAPARFPSVSQLMARYRREWMVQFVTREPRIYDASVLEGLRQGTAFFASTALIAIGGGLALLGNANPVVNVARELALQPPPPAEVQVRALVVILFLANAFLKFVWAHRLFGYCAIVMASAPNDPSDPLALHRAGQAAEINISAAKGFNRGLRSVYFALGSLGWLLGWPALLAGTAVTVAVLWRREFASHSRRVMIDLG
jgi:uncharacterized membrane protein